MKIMKLKYYIPVLAAVVALFTGCKSDDDPIYLDSVQLSTTFVALSTEGSATTVRLNAAGDWAFDKVDARTVTNEAGEKVTTYHETPEWLTVSPLSGVAGQDIELTFSATEATATRVAMLKLTCGGQTQEINVVQYAQEAEPEVITTAQAVAMIKAGTQPASAVYVKGIVCRIQEISPQYGNATFFISDDGSYGDGNWLEIYRGKWLNGANYTTGDEFAVGDEMVVKGVLIDLFQRIRQLLLYAVGKLLPFRSVHAHRQRRGKLVVTRQPKDVVVEVTGGFGTLDVGGDALQFVINLLLEVVELEV